MRSKWQIVVLALLAAFAACNRAPKPENNPGVREAVELRVVRPEVQSIEAQVPITGSLVSTVQVDVKTEQAGRLVTNPPRAGEFVTRGQVLARLDDSNYRLASQQARAGLAVAEAGLERTRIAVEHAGRELERARNVKASGGITEKDFQTAEWAARDARAQQGLAEAQVQQAREALATAEKRLRDCTILAPISGEVQAHMNNAGVYLDFKEPLVRLVDNTRLELEATVPSSVLAQLRPGQTVRFTVDAWPGEVFSGKLLHIAPAVNEQSRSLKLRVAAPNPARRLKAGMFARGGVVTGTRAEALVLPAAAVVRDAANPLRAVAVVVQNGVVRRRTIEIGLEQARTVEIAQGLAPHETVAAEAQLAPPDGERVRPVPASRLPLSPHPAAPPTAH